MYYGLSEYIFKSAENDGNVTIVAMTDYYLIDASPSDFEIRDSANALFNVLDIEYGNTKNELIMTVDNLGFSAPDDLTLKFLGGTTKAKQGKTLTRSRLRSPRQELTMSKLTRRKSR